MYCSEHSTVNRGPQAGVAVSLRCKCWHCEICQPFNRGRVIKRAKRGDPTTFLTLTCRPDLYESPAAAAQAMVRGWRLLRRRLAKRFGGKAPPFIAVFEAHKSGFPHLHILLRMGFVAQAWLSDQWEQITGAFRVDIQRVGNRKAAAAYCAKYVGKAPHRFAGTQRFWSSRDWLATADPEEEREALPGDRWWKVKAPLHEVARLLQADGVAFEWNGHRIQWSGDWFHGPPK